ncbi:MAG: Pvc16 family protein [Bacteroidota bacterium]
MLHTVLSIVVDDLNTHLSDKYNPTNREIVALRNAAKQDFDQPVAVSDAQVYAHFLSLEKDHTYRNDSSVTEINSTISEYYKAQFNVYLLFVFNSEQYAQSLMFLSDVVTYYQGKRYLERDENGEGNVTISDTTIASDPAFKLEMIYHNVSLEDSYNMWSNLGNKQQPYVIFKLRVVEFDPGPHTGRKASKISDVSQNILDINSN